MRFDEPCTIVFQLKTDHPDGSTTYAEDYTTHGFFADVNDEGAVLAADADEAAFSAEAYTVTCRWSALPLPVLQDFIGSRAYIGVPTRLYVNVRGRNLQVTSVTAGDERRRVLTLTIDGITF